MAKKEKESTYTPLITLEMMKELQEQGKPKPPAKLKRPLGMDDKPKLRRPK